MTGTTKRRIAWPGLALGLCVGIIIGAMPVVWAFGPGSVRAVRILTCDGRCMAVFTGFVVNSPSEIDVYGGNKPGMVVGNQFICAPELDKKGIGKCQYRRI